MTGATIILGKVRLVCPAGARQTRLEVLSRQVRGSEPPTGARQTRLEVLSRQVRGSKTQAEAQVRCYWLTLEKFGSR